MDQAQLLAWTNAGNRVELAADKPALFEAWGYRWISSPGDAVQTAMQIAAPQRLVLENHRAMLLAALLPSSIGTVLDLGMGGAACLRHISAVYPRAKITAVELDVSMLQLAREFFALPASQAVHIDDAATFLVRDSQYYDLVLCDVFAGRETPLALQTPEFYALLSSRLRNGAAVALNTLPESRQMLTNILQAAKATFSGIGIIQFEALGNVVLLLQQRTLPSASALADRLACSAYASDLAAKALLDRLLRFE
ncbi:MAG: spermidine synthase [Congregibacter sp.]